MAKISNKILGLINAMATIFSHLATQGDLFSHFCSYWHYIVLSCFQAELWRFSIIHTEKATLKQSPIDSGISYIFSPFSDIYVRFSDPDRREVFGHVVCKFSGHLIGTFSNSACLFGNNHTENKRSLEKWGLDEAELDRWVAEKKKSQIYKWNSLFCSTKVPKYGHCPCWKSS